MNPKDLMYSKTHEWIRVEKDLAGNRIGTVGITAFAVEALTDLVYIDLPQVGRKVQAGQPCGEVESVKAVSDLYAPVDGEIVAVNNSLPDNLERLGSDPYGEGWIARIKLAAEAGLSHLMNQEAYEKQCAEEHG